MDERYSAYLLSAEWQQKRIACFARVGRRCEACGSREKLQCHHLTYARIFDESPDDLMALCDPHHGLIEQLYKEGKITKTGDTTILRRQTVELLCGKPFPSTSTGTSKIYSALCPTNNEIDAELMGQPEFIRALEKTKKDFKKWAKKRFDARHKYRQRYLSHAHMIFVSHASRPKSDSSIMIPTKDEKETFDDELRSLIRKHIGSANLKRMVRDLLKSADALLVNGS